MNVDYKYDRHQELCKRINDIYRRKNETYHDSFGRTFKKYGPISALTRISDKFDRFENLTLGAENRVPDETVVDTLLDMANYCLMTIIEMETIKPRETAVYIGGSPSAPHASTGSNCASNIRCSIEPRDTTRDIVDRDILCPCD